MPARNGVRRSRIGPEVGPATGHPGVIRGCRRREGGGSGVFARGHADEGRRAAPLLGLLQDRLPDIDRFAL